MRDLVKEANIYISMCRQSSRDFNLSLIKSVAVYLTNMLKVDMVLAVSSILCSDFFAASRYLVLSRMTALSDSRFLLRASYPLGLVSLIIGPGELCYDIVA